MHERSRRGATSAGRIGALAVELRRRDTRVAKVLGARAALRGTSEARGELTELAPDSEPGERPSDVCLSEGTASSAAAVAHDLRAPLSAILGWCELLRTDVPGVRERAIATIERNARLASGLVEDLLDRSMLARVGLARVDLGALVAEVVEGVLPAARRAGVSLRLATAGGLLVAADPRRVEQIVQNLLGNALKFTPEGGEVDVIVARRDRAIELVVRDSGRGIAADLLPHVFDPYVRGPDAALEGGGVGLGLFIVRRLVELQSGSVRVASEGVGRGATFTVALPVLVEPALA